VIQYEFLYLYALSIADACYRAFQVWRMGTQLVPLLARLLTTLAALPLDSHESRVGAHVSGCRSDGSKSNSGQMHNILSKALTFALDATSPVGISVENIENGARVAAASFLRCARVFFLSHAFFFNFLDCLLVSYAAMR